MGEAGVEPRPKLEDLLRQICCLEGDHDRRNNDYNDLYDRVLDHPDCSMSALADFIGHPEKFGADRNNGWWERAAGDFFTSDVFNVDDGEILRQLTVEQMIDCDLFSASSTTWWEYVMEKAKSLPFAEQVHVFRRIMIIPRQERDSSRKLFLRHLIGCFNIPDGCLRAQAVNHFFGKNDVLNNYSAEDEFLNAMIDVIVEDVARHTPADSKPGNPLDRFTFEDEKHP